MWRHVLWRKGGIVSSILILNYLSFKSFDFNINLLNKLFDLFHPPAIFFSRFFIAVKMWIGQSACFSVDSISKPSFFFSSLLILSRITILCPLRFFSASLRKRSSSFDFSFASSICLRDAVFILFSDTISVKVSHFSRREFVTSLNSAHCAIEEGNLESQKEFLEKIGSNFILLRRTSF